MPSQFDFSLPSSGSTNLTQLLLFLLPIMLPTGQQEAAVFHSYTWHVPSQLCAFAQYILYA